MTSERKLIDRRTADYFVPNNQREKERRRPRRFLKRPSPRKKPIAHGKVR